MRRGGNNTERERVGSEGTSAERSGERERERRDGTERDSFSRWRDRQYFGPRRWLESALRDSNWEKDSGEN